MSLVPLPIRLKRAGIVYPNWTRRAASLAKLDLAFLCAILMLETGGGVNEFGHDPTICVGWGTVTEGKAKAYLRLRDATDLCQGVGPMQLTSRGLQDEATNAGGLWLPEHTIAVGAHYLAALVADRRGFEAGAAAYNGSGPAAEAYGRRAVILQAHFRTVVN